MNKNYKKLKLRCCLIISTLLLSCALYAQQSGTTAIGIVLDESSEPMIGVTVLAIEQPSLGTSTDLDGKFTLSGVKIGETLQFKIIGMKVVEVIFRGSPLKVTLEVDAVLMENVVVIAYGEQKRSTFTGSASVVSSAAIARRPVSNVMNALEGMSSGVQVQSTSGAPGSSPSFRIRGASSINAGRDPLIVVDGVPYESGLNNVNPNDVESVTILKDAASTAIYGARGGNGVVLVTTKKAGRQDKIAISFDTGFAISNMRSSDLYDVIENPGEYYERHYDALYNYFQNVAGHNSFQANNAANGALAYLDLFRMYEYKKTGVATLDGLAEKDKIRELTTVIIDEYFDEANAYSNPRVSFFQMYRFIMNDLNRAEKYLKKYKRTDKTKADLSVVQSYKARLWLEIATRFQKYPDDLQTQLAHENDEQLAQYDKLGITSAKDCYQNAATYARNAMSDYNPLSEDLWHSKTNGFNDASVNSWIFAITITSPDAVYSRVNNFLSFSVTEYSRGYGRSQYHCYRMIDKNLYDEIDDKDWRKVTWVDPADKGKNPTPTKYHTLLNDKEWALRDAYVGFKFRPNKGDISDDYKNALQVDFPVIRVEEMYFIEAEAKAYTEGLSSGVGALTSFLNGHRYTDNSYSVSPSSVDDFVDNYLITQKRIELWGEGLSFFDIKRREIALTRGYKGTNWLPATRFNSHQGYAASWMNLYIPNEGEASLNHAIIMNPDPAVLDSYGLWVDK